jgi:hypothetical protein
VVATLSSARLTKDLVPSSLGEDELSQILWAGYGCSAHEAFNASSATTTPSWRGQYFLTDTIYVARAEVHRFCNHQGSDERTRDHRLETVRDSDARAAVAQTVPGLARADCYILLCLPESDASQWYALLETGFVAGGLLLQATALGMRCDMVAGLEPQQQADLRAATGLPRSHVPHAVVALGAAPSTIYLPSARDN